MITSTRRWCLNTFKTFIQNKLRKRKTQWKTKLQHQKLNQIPCKSPQNEDEREDCEDTSRFILGLFNRSSLERENWGVESPGVVILVIFSNNASDEKWLAGVSDK